MRKLRATADRVEGDTAVLDVEGHALTVPSEWLPHGVREGDGFVLTIEPDPRASEDLARSVKERLKKLTGG